MRGTSTIGNTETYGYNLGLMAGIKNNEPLKYLEQQRASAWKELAKREPELVRTVEQWDEAIAKIKGEPGEYSSYRVGADAVVAYLRNHGPSERRAVCNAICEGGWAKGHLDPYWKLWDAISYQLEKSDDPKIVSLGRDMIGLPEHAKRVRKK